MTNACIGWFAEPECPIYGWAHGCRKDAPHGNTPHVCACGDWRRSPWREREPNTKPINTNASAQSDEVAS